VRRISLAQSVTFERIHEQAYRNHGFELVNVPAATIAERWTSSTGASGPGPNDPLAPPAAPSARPLSGYARPSAWCSTSEPARSDGSGQPADLPCRRAGTRRSALGVLRTASYR
jgi:hypothetical protein